MTISPSLTSIVFDHKRNVFFAGAAGTGKSHKLKELYCEARERNVRVALTASTGQAALNIGGQTLHRWAGILLGKDNVSGLVNLISKNKKSLKRWKSIELLMIDEISMIGKTLFEKLDAIGKILRKNENPFGGIQLIISGDFLQLQPIQDAFVFKSDVWTHLNFHIEKFTIPYRYTDIKFYELLQRARLGQLTDDDVALLQSRVQPFHIEKNCIKPSTLHCLNVDVSSVNLAELDKLSGTLFRYSAEDTFSKNVERAQRAKYIEYMDKTILPCVFFKVGAQVMLTVNVPDSPLVNGSRGVVTSCDNFGVHVQFKNLNYYVVKHDFEFDVSDDPLEKKTATRKQLPLILAYAFTIHKIQGSTLDCAIANIGNSLFTFALGYVALSRVRTIDGLFLTDFDPKKVKADPEALAFTRMLEA